MEKRGLKIMVAVALAAVCVFGLAGGARASSWSDLPDSVIHQYGLTADQVGQLSQGFGSGLWLPSQIISRAQFVRMATVVFDIPAAAPMVPTYKDVDETEDYYSFIEGATSAGLVSGVGGGLFLPNGSISRQQAAAIVAREIAAANGLDLDRLYSSSSATAVLARFSDGGFVSASLRNAVAFAVERGLMHGDQAGRLSPNGLITRIQAAALLVRAGAPEIISISPASGSAAGGTAVTISGIGFVGVWQIGAVRFGLTDAMSYTVDSARQITAIAPAGTPGTSVQVSVSDASGVVTAGSAQSYFYVNGAPTVLSVGPGSGPAAGGNVVTISGGLFLGVTGVKFGSTPAASFTIASASQINAVAPPGTEGATVDVIVTGPGGSSAGSVDAEYTYGAPVVTSIYPAAGPAKGGNTVLITGVGLYGASDVLFGSKSASGLTFNSPTQITVVAPAGADVATVDIRVVGPGGTSLATLASKYAYGAPLVTSVSPHVGPAGGHTSVIIRGSGFTGLTGASAVRFGGRDALSYQVVSDTYVIAVSPPGTAGISAAVTVTNPAGTSPGIATFLYYGS
jgi:hypothetical protein